jgi:uncharacterized RDD family membrane protein YckC
MEPTVQAAEMRFAGFWRRMAVIFIDGAIVSAVLGAVLVAWILIEVFAFGLEFDDPLEGGSQEAQVDRQARREANIESYVSRRTGVAGWTLAPVIILYNIGFWAWRGQTPAMVVLGIRLVRTDGSRIGFGKAVVHCLGVMLSSLVFFVGYVTIIWDKKKQGIHDKMSKTYVVRTSRSRTRRRSRSME